MYHISLFSGIGGFDLAATWAGWENIVSCEINPVCQRLLQYYWPESYHHDNIHTLNYKKINEELTKKKGRNWRTKKIIISGGFPCQPYSTSGKRKGNEDPRHLWPEMLRTIKEIQPDWVVGENVFGLVNWNGGMVFNEVQIELENQGYQVQPYLLPACGKDAPHKRYRIFIVAYRDNSTTKYKIPTGRKELATLSNKQPFTYTFGSRKKPYGKSNKTKGVRSRNNFQHKKRFNKAKRFNGFSNVLRYSSNAFFTNTNSTGGGENYRQRKSKLFNENGKRNNWKNWPTQSPICSGVNGISDQLDGITFSKWRNESLKGYGNAVVPQLVLSIFNCINKYEEILNQSKI
jgi:DNA (cytosine-5)-methyltransferase 1